MTNEKQTTLISTLRRGWQQAVDWGYQHHTPRKIYYGAYAIFFCGFFFFPSSKSHNNFFYVTLLLPSLIILRYLFSTFFNNLTFRLIITYLAYLILTNFWGVNVTLENVYVQVKHLFYVLAFITASIVVEAYYPQNHNRLLVAMAGVATIAFLVNTLWWYQSHSFPTERLFDLLGRMDNPVLAGCIAGVACLVLVDILLNHGEPRIRIAAGGAFAINLGFILLGQSRTALAAMIPSLLVLGMAHLRRNYRLVILAALLAATSVILLQDALVAALNRNSYRIDIWLATLEKAQSNLWWGRGYFCDRVALQIDGVDMLHAHNAYLATLRDGGVVGIVLLVGVAAVAAWRAWRQVQATNRYLTLALLTFGLTAVFFDSDRLIDNPEELWIFFWYPFCRIIAYDLTHEGQLNTSSWKIGTELNKARI